MKLRKWHSASISLAMMNYSLGAKHFLVLATPGAGKTIFATKLAREMFENSLIDLIFCFSPTSIVSIDFADSLALEFNSRFDGKLGAMGHSTTYQNMKYLDSEFWSLLDEYNVLVVFDEIHHCAGLELEGANSWGEQILLKIQNRATYTLALTGTPWRSDLTPIVLSKYCKDTQNIICDYRYGLEKAIKDSVCRVPIITIIDNDHIEFTHKGEGKAFRSLKELLKLKESRYQSIIEDLGVISELVVKGDNKLNEIRQCNPSAGGLIVASSIQHAHKIKAILENTTKEVATIVTCHEESPNKIIRDFRQSTSKWLISVGMVSEGTNIPRLQVCVHLTNIKTELHYRQILGRILRFTDSPVNYGYLYMPAHPLLVEFAYRIAEDIPKDSQIINHEKAKTPLRVSAKESKNLGNSIPLNEKGSLGFHGEFSTSASEDFDKNPLSDSYEKMLGIVGRFKDEVLKINLSSDI